MPQKQTKEELKKKKLYDLGDPGNKEIILEFERFIKNLEDKSGEPKEVLVYYGRPHFEWKESRIVGKGFNSFIPNERVGYVFNPIFGLVHWSLVDYCLKNSIVTRDKNGNWKIVGHKKDYFVADQGYREGVITPEYDDFNTKMIRLTELKEKRHFAKQQEINNLESLVGSF